jgi:murein L,D-transpeptidase YafK
MKVGVLALMMLQVQSFKDSQLKFERVNLAYNQKESRLRNLFAVSSIPYTGFHLFIRAFKKEQLVEMWVKPKNGEKFSLLHTYDFCTISGTLGPKRKEGDLQIPEGVYAINSIHKVIFSCLSE